MPLATGETVGTNSKLNLKAPVKVQKSTDSTITATFADSGPTFTGTMNTDSINITSGGLGTLALSTTGRITIGSNVQTPTLKIPGANANDSLTVQNSLGSIVARFQNDYACLLNGNTSVTGNITGSGELYAGGPVSFNQTLAVRGNATVAGALTAGGTNVKTALDGPSTNYYTKTQVNETFANLIDSAPTALNTLKELASALGNDANYASTVQNQLALKAPKDYPTFTGSLNADATQPALILLAHWL